MAFPPASEVIGLALTTLVVALWVYAVALWALAEVFEAPGARSYGWAFGLAVAATGGHWLAMRSGRMKKRESK